MSRPRTALVVGAGIGGLAAAAALAARGIAVDVVETRPGSTVYGVGINQPANSLRALNALGVLDRLREVGSVYDKHLFFDREGETIAVVEAHLGEEGIPPNLGLTRRDLHDALLAAVADAEVEVRYATRPAELVEAGEKVEVTFSDRSAGSYDLVAGFDGIHSEMRGRLFGDAHEPVHTRHAVWRVTKPRVEGTDQACLYQGVRAKAGHIPISEELMYLLLVVPAEPDEHPPREERAAILRELLGQFGSIPGAIRDSLGPEDDIVFSPLEEVLLPPPWSRGRVVIAGDAAHACMPHTTQGAAMAIEDAVVLAEEVGVDRPVVDSLRAFDERRYPRVRRVQEVARAILDGEMLIDSDAALDRAKESMAKGIPARLQAFDAFIDGPA